MPYIVSKASQDIEYTAWDTTTKPGMVKPIKSVTIHGGANVINKTTLETPKGAITEVTDEELEFLMNSSAFKRHLERGWMHIENSKGAAEKKVSIVEKDDDGFDRKDGSSQLTDDDFERAGKKPPVIGGATKRKKK